MIPRPRREFAVMKIRLAVPCLSVIAALSSLCAVAQQAPAPVPPALLSASSIFVSNAGADSGLFPSPFSGDVNRGYNQLYAGLKASG